ncbi:MAG: DNA recombination protein RmuC [Actinomycetota bacterium]|nr:DNA recombination protein RmuC [Actinomycetota bacterium]MEC8502344.1 DNA recombination protein RmuC [Actinomycetota bacterium]MEC8520647.1 DNA recombination protein RmuC [Actinomycetota bacterium]MEC9224983.1 DNA recombination protein RmuC [Actinomycetota bacterium]
MEILIVVLLAAVLVALAGVIATSRKPAPVPTAPPHAFPSTEELTSQIKLVNEQALNGAIAELNQRAEAHREETIRTVTQMVTQQSGEALGKRAEVISTTLKGVHNDVSKRLAELNHELDQLRQHNAGQFSSVSEAVTLLSQRTADLNEVLSSSQKRGQWGERLAEDMIRAAGLVEGVNYSKQDTTAAGGRPDFTFTMPPDRVLFMDVKFPLDRYVAHLDADDDATRATTKADFVKAVRSHVDALAKRDYIDQTTEDALDYVLMFVPNESISGFVHEADPHLIDWALERKVVLCSPLTLYAFLVVIRQATESFHTEQTAAEITQQINKFSKEFDNYSAAVDKVRATFNKLDNELGAIATDGTRFRKLSVPVRDIEKLRKRQGIGELDAATDSALKESIDDF